MAQIGDSDELSAELIRRNREIATVRDSLLKVEARLDESQVRNGELLEKNAELDAENTRGTTRIAELEDRLGVLTAAKDMAAKQLAEEHIKKEELSSQLLVSQAERENMAVMLEAARLQSDERQREIDDLRTRLEAGEKHQSEARHALLRSDASLQEALQEAAGHRSRVRELEKEVQDRAGRADEELRAKLAMEIEARTTAQETVSKIMAEQKDLQHQLQVYRERSQELSTEVTDLQQRLKAQQGREEDLIGEVAEQQRSLQAWEVKAKEAGDQNFELRARLEVEGSCAKSLTSEISELRSRQLETLGLQQKFAAQEEHVKELDAQLSALQLRLEDADGRAERLDSSLAQESELRQRAEAERGSMTVKLEKAESALAEGSGAVQQQSQRVSTLEAALAKEQVQRDDVTRGLQQQLADQASRLTDQKEVQERVEKEAAAEKQRAANWASEAHELRRKLDLEGGRIDEVRRQYTDVSAQLQDALQRADDAMHRAETSTISEKTLQLKLVETQESFAKLTAELRSSEEERSEVSKALQTAEVTLASERSTLDATRIHLDQQSQLANDRSLGECRELRDELSAASAKLQRQSQDVLEAEQLRGALAEARRNLQEMPVHIQDTVEIEALQGKVTELESQLAQGEARGAFLAERSRQLQIKCVGLEEAKSRAETDRREVDSQRQECLTELNTVRAHESEARESAAQARAEADAARSERGQEVGQLRAALDQLRSAIKSQVAEIRPNRPAHVTAY